MKLRTFLASLAVLVFSTSVAFADSKFNQVKPGEFDPAKSILVQAAWLNGTGCPTSQQIQQYKAVPPYRLEIVIYQDPGCPTGDSKDKKNEGLLLVKTGPVAKIEQEWHGFRAHLADRSHPFMGRCERSI